LKIQKKKQARKSFKTNQQKENSNLEK